MTNKPIRRAAKGWARRLKKMWGVTLRPKVTDSYNVFHFFQTSERKVMKPEPIFGAYTRNMVKKNKYKGTVFVAPDPIPRGPVSAKRFQRLVAAHELGHAAKQEKGRPYGPLSDFLAVLSEMEYAKRYQRPMFKTFSENPAEFKEEYGEIHPHVDHLVRQFMERYPHAAERERIVQKIIQSRANRIYEIAGIILENRPQKKKRN